MRVRFRSEAEAELSQALEWYAARSLDTARRFFVQVDQVISCIAADPLRFPRVGRLLRRAAVRGFPYAVYYLEMADDIMVVGVVHGRRDPALWRQRE